MWQTWTHLGFLHWEVPEVVLRPRVPAALDLDGFEGRFFVGIVPFSIPATQAPFAPLPLLPGFHEINVRTYVRRRGADPGVYFFSLDAASTVAVVGARLAYGLPYHRAHMSLVAEDGEVRYASRRARGGAAFVGRYAPAGPARPSPEGTLEHFLAERYVLYARHLGLLLRARVRHAPYPLQAATAHVEEESLCAAAGLPTPSGPPLAHFASAVSVLIEAPVPAS
jgi:uncharacterized protein YqjF (DUF2071 family)